MKTMFNSTKQLKCLSWMTCFVFLTQIVQAGLLEVEPQEVLTQETRNEIVQAFSLMPANFIENKELIADQSVKYSLQGTSTTVHFHDDLVDFGMTNGDSKNPQVARFAMSFINALPTKVTASQELRAKINHFAGSDQSKWKTGISTYGQLNYDQLYKGIDLKIWGNRQKLKYEYHVAPGADPSQIHMAFHGIEKITLEPSGDLHIHTTAGKVVDYAPIAFQIIDGKKVNVDVTYNLIDDLSYGFSINSKYDKSKPLIIDPDILWATMLGGYEPDTAWAIDVDNAGKVYVAGVAGRFDFISEIVLPSSAYEASVRTGNGFLFLCKFDLTQTGANQLDYWVTMGGDGIPVDLKVGPTGKVYMTGGAGTGHPVVNAYDATTNGNSDVFLTVVAATGDSISYSTFLGGAAWDSGAEMVLDSSEKVYLVGRIDYDGGVAMPVGTADAYQQNHNDTTTGVNDGFLAIFDTSQSGSSSLEYLSYIGGTSYDSVSGLALQNDDIYVSGITLSTDLPTTVGAYDTTHNGEYDMFFMKLKRVAGSPGSTTLNYSTYFGGSLSETTESNGTIGADIAVDSTGKVFIANSTNSPGLVEGTSTVDFPLVNARDNDLNATGLPDDYDFVHVRGVGWTDQILPARVDVFIAKFQLDGLGQSDLLYSTYFGGTKQDWFGDMEIFQDRIYITGWTTSTDFEFTSCAYRTTWYGHLDPFLSLFSNTGDLLYSAPLGGADRGSPNNIPYSPQSGNHEHAYDITVHDGKVYVAGNTNAYGYGCRPGIPLNNTACDEENQAPVIAMPISATAFQNYYVEPYVGFNESISIPRQMDGFAMKVNPKLCGDQIPGDFNDNGAIDCGDVPLFFESYGRRTYFGICSTDPLVECGADLDGDNDIDRDDFNLFGALLNNNNIISVVNLDDVTTGIANFEYICNQIRVDHNHNPANPYSNITCNSSGRVFEIQTTGEALLKVYDDIHGNFSIGGNSKAIFDDEGGNGPDVMGSVVGRDNGFISVNGGATTPTTDLGHIILHDSSELVFTEGNSERLNLNNNARAFMAGGDFINDYQNVGAILYHDNTKLYVYGSNFKIDDVAKTPGTYTFTGSPATINLKAQLASGTELGDDVGPASGVNIQFFSNLAELILVDGNDWNSVWALPTHCLGDADGDGDIDCDDLTILLNAADTVSTDPNYDPAADFDHDFDVDINDYITWTTNKGC